MENQEVKKFKTKAEYVEMLKREFYEIESIMENVSEIKAEIKEAGFDATLLAKISKAMAENKADEIIQKNEDFAAGVDEVRNS
jgi:uncharacterized protein (UPF0335 family)